MRFDLAADSLIGFDSLLLAVTGQARDTSAESRPLGGAAIGRVELAGSLDSLQAERRRGGIRLRVAAHALAPDDRQPHLARRPAAQRHRARRLPTRSGCDRWLLTRAAGAGRRLRRLARLERRHRRWATPRASTGRAQWYANGDARLLWVDSLLAKLAVRRYRLDEPIVMTLATRRRR